MNKNKHFILVSFMALALLIVFNLTGNVSAATPSVITDSADWVLTQQDPSGLFPWTPGGATAGNITGPIANGLLNAYRETGDQTYLNAAILSGDELVNNPPRTYPDGDPRFSTHDPLFLEQLSLLTGDSTYADFTQAHFWDELTAGTYGEFNNLDAAGYAQAVIDARTSQGIAALATWDISAIPIGAQIAGEVAIRDAFMGKIESALEALSVSDADYAIIGLAGAIWASAETGIDLTPVIGRYAGMNTASLAALLATKQSVSASDSGGSWPSSEAVVVQFVNSGNAWRVDFGNYFETTMTKQFTNVTNATISFDMLRNIEADWDYGQVLVSTDGINFTPLAGTYTTNTDPYGQNPGNGITGFVAGDASVTENMTIPGFVSGSTYWVQFRFIADAGSSGNGASALTYNWELDNINIDGTLNDNTGWNVAYTSTDGGTQGTAFGLLAMEAYDRMLYYNNIVAGLNFLERMQDASGQFVGSPGSSPNQAGAVEITGEALTALVTLSTFDVPVSATAVEIQALIDNAAPCTTFVFPAGTYSPPTNGFIINTDCTTLKLSSGTTYGHGSPFAVVNASDVTITGGVLDGLGDPNPAILLQAGADNFTLEGTEVLNWNDGVEVAADVTSLKIVSNFIHNNVDAALQINSGVTVNGIVTVEGNLFKANGTGVHNDGVNALNAQYNSWGALAGPAAGDTTGATAVDTTNFTFIEMFMDVDPDTLALTRTVDENETFDVKLKLDAAKVAGFSFQIAYDPTYLTLNSTTFEAPWTSGACQIYGAPPVGTVQYFCNLLGSSYDATASATEGDVVTLNFTADGAALTGNGSWTTLFDINHSEASASAGGPGGVKVFVNNAGFGAPSVPDRDITDGDDGEINITGQAQYTGFIDLQGRSNDSGALLEVFDLVTIVGSTKFADATSAAGGGYITSYLAPYFLSIGNTYWLYADAPLYLPTTPIADTDYVHSMLLDTRPTTALNNLVLLGGDAENDDDVDIVDATCIGGDYGVGPSLCGTDGSSDVNGDGVVNILDLTLMGTNYNLFASSWTP